MHLCRILTLLMMDMQLPPIALLLIQRLICKPYSQVVALEMEIPASNSASS